MGVALILNTLFTIVEIVGGFLTNSVSILSDAMHDLGDSVALGMAWYFERISKRGRDTNHTYGYRRYSVLGAVVSAIVLISGSLLIMREAVIRIAHPEAVHSQGMIILAVFGIVINGIAFKYLRGGSSQNAEVMSLHLLEDVLGWVAVLLGAIAIQIWSIYFLDPLLSLLISIWVLTQVIRRLRKSLRILMQNTPAGINADNVEQLIRSLPGVRETHDTHLWTMDGDYHVLTMHVVLEEQKTMSELAKMKETLRKHLDTLHIEHATFEFEYPDETCVLIEC